MKKLFKTLSALLVTAVAMTALTMPVAADTQYDAITGNKVTFYKTLIVDKDAKIPNLVFTFSTAGGGAVPNPGSGKIPVLDGTGTIDPVTVRFTPTTAFDAPDNAHGVSTDYKTATLPVEINLTAATYSEPGVYRYYITEADGDSRVLYDVDENLRATTGARVRTLDVYVEDTGASTPALAVTGYVMYLGEVTAAPSIGTNATNGNAVSGNVVIGESGIYVKGNTVTEATSAGTTKTNYIMNAYKTHDLTFGKEVIGNQGSRDKYFKVTVTCTGLNDTDEFPVDMSHAEKTPTKTTATSYTATEMAAANDIIGDKLTGTQLKAGYNFYLQDGNYVTIVGLPEGCHYTVSETAEDYTSNQKISETNSSLDWDGNAGADALNDKLDDDLNTDKHTGFTNEKKGVIPTGVLLVATPVIIVALIAVAGVVFCAVRSAKNRAQEDEAETAEE